MVGIDIGNVIIGGGGQERGFFTENYLATPQIYGAFDSIKELVNVGHEVVLISKCGAPVMAKTVNWLQTHEFFEYTGVDIDSVYFVPKREDKAPLAQQLGVEIMIDDREDIIESMQGVVALPILFEDWETTMELIRKNDNEV